MNDNFKKYIVFWISQSLSQLGSAMTSFALVLWVYRGNPLLLQNMLVYDDGILKRVINRGYKDDTVEISEFYIEPFFKRQGIGRKLI